MKLRNVLNKIHDDWSDNNRMVSNPQATRNNLFKILDYLGNLPNKEKQEIITIDKLINLIGGQAETLKCLQYLTGCIEVLDAQWIDENNNIIPNDIVCQVNSGQEVLCYDKLLTRNDIFLALQISESYYNDNHNNLVGN